MAFQAVAVQWTEFLKQNQNASCTLVIPVRLGTCLVCFIFLTVSFLSYYSQISEKKDYIISLFLLMGQTVMPVQWYTVNGTPFIPMPHTGITKWIQRVLKQNYREYMKLRGNCSGGDRAGLRGEKAESGI